MGFKVVVVTSKEDDTGGQGQCDYVHCSHAHAHLVSPFLSI